MDYVIEGIVHLKSFCVTERLFDKNSGDILYSLAMEVGKFKPTTLIPKNF